MTEQEYQQVYQELATMLYDLQLGWIAEQVETKIYSGEISEEDLAVQLEAATTQAVLVKSEISVAQAKLLYLIDAVEKLVISSLEIEGVLVDFLVEQSTRSCSPTTLSFESENAPLLTSSDAGLEQRQDEIAQLRELLQALRQEAFSGV
jgi:hypothetical protein